MFLTQDAAEAADTASAENTVPAIEIPTDLDGIQNLANTAKEKVIEFAPAVVGALAILFIGWIIARIVRKVVAKALGKSKLDETLIGFVSSLVYMGFMAFVLVAALGKLGVNTTSFAAIIGAATFAIGFALQGSLASFAAGVMLMIFRPMKKGDLVEAGGVLGVVEEVGVFATIINTPDNKRCIVANSTVTGGNIINYTANGSIRVDMTFGIGYDDDMDKAIELMESILSTDPRVLKEPGFTVACSGHGASSVDFACRPWVHPNHYWDVWFDTHKAVKEAFDKNGISIPFPQQDVWMHQVASPEMALKSA